MSEPSFVPLLAALNEHGVEYFVVGALAAVLQGAPVVTFDVNIVHRRTPENIERLLGALRALDAYYRLDPRKLRPNETHLVTKGHQLLCTRLGDLDVLGTIMAASGYDDLIAEVDRTAVTPRKVEARSIARRVDVDVQELTLPRALFVRAVGTEDDVDDAGDATRQRRVVHEVPLELVSSSEANDMPRCRDQPGSINSPPLVLNATPGEACTRRSVPNVSPTRSAHVRRAAWTITLRACGLV